MHFARWLGCSLLTCVSLSGVLPAQNPPPPLPTIGNRLGVVWNPQPTNILRRDLLVPDMAPNRLIATTDRLYATGNFGNFGQSTGSSARLALTDAVLDVAWPRVDGPIRSILSDGAGGWFVAGNFSRIESHARRCLAKVLPNGDVDTSFDAHIQGSEVEALALANGVLYFAGGIGPVAGQARQALAAVDALTGTLLAWNPILGPSWGSSSRIRALAVHGDRVYAGGEFQETVQGVSRRHLMVVERLTGLISPWDPGLDADVRDFSLEGGILALAGQFSQILGAARSRVAMLDAATGTLLPFSITLNSTVFSVKLASGTVYVGGLFSSANGTTRNRAAAFDSATGVLLPWNPNLSEPLGGDLNVLDIEVAGPDVVLAGCFAKVGPSPREHVALVHGASGVARPWHCRLVGGTPTRSFCAAVDGNAILVGGDFTLAHAVKVTGVCALSLDNGSALPWAPVASGTRDLVEVGHRVFLGGNLFSVNGVARRMLAAVDAATGTVTLPFDASSQFTVVSNTVHAIAYGNGILYAAGDFQRVSGPASLIAVDPLTGSPIAGWDAEIGGAAYDIALSEDGSRLYVGGQFSSAGDPPLPRQNLAVLDALTGAALPQICNASGPVSCVLETAGRLYVGGAFTSIMGVPVPALAQLNPATGLPYDWTPLLNPGGGVPTVVALARYGRLIYLGGAFQNLNGVWSPNLGAVDAEYAIMANWGPAPSPSVSALAVAKGRVYVGGEFLTLGGVVMPHLAAFEIQ